MRPLLLLCVLCVGCWDFAALGDGGAGPDDGGAVDFSSTDLVCRSTALVEDCSDGIDNDGDCAVDCADSECASRESCAPIADLLGYGLLTRGGSPGVCPPGTSVKGPFTFFDKIDPDQKACSGCTCEAPTACTSEVRFYSKNGCKNNDLLMPKVAVGAVACGALDVAVRMASSAIVDEPRLQCQAGGNAAKPNPAFQQSARLCLTDGVDKDCFTASCVLAQLRGQRACIAVSGMSCPAPFTSKETWSRTYTDARTCACSCGGGAANCEGTATVVANSATCMDNSKTPLTAGACKDLPAAFMSFGLDYTIKPKAGTMCTPSGVAQGSATLSDPLTICCLPAN